MRKYKHTHSWNQTTLHTWNRNRLWTSPFHPLPFARSLSFPIIRLLCWSFSNRCLLSVPRCKGFRMREKNNKNTINSNILQNSTWAVALNMAFMLLCKNDAMGRRGRRKLHKRNNNDNKKTAFCKMLKPTIGAFYICCTNKDHFQIQRITNRIEFCASKWKLLIECAMKLHFQTCMQPNANTMGHHRNTFLGHFKFRYGAVFEFAIGLSFINVVSG